MDKLKLVGNNLFGSGDNKAQAWLDGFLKIPLGIYRENPIINFLKEFTKKIDKFLKDIKGKNRTLHDRLLNLGIPETEVEIDGFVKILNNSLNDSNEYAMENLDEQRDLSKLINNISKQWKEYKENRINYIKNVRDILDISVYGNHEGKKQIESIIGQWINGKTTGAILGFQGPPGVGKTTLAKRGLCKCLKDVLDEPRPFSFIPLGGSTNGSVLGGTWIYLCWCNMG